MTTVHVVSTADIIWAIITLAFPFMLWGTIRNLRTRKPPATRSVTIVVLGDIGRSPRMMYHAESFANAGFDTVMVGYYETAPPPSLLTAPGIQFFRLMPPPKLPKKLFVFLAPLKVMVQILSLSYALLIGWRPHRPPQFILVQNPPSIPTLAIVQLAAWMRGSNLILDWHNLGYSILALKLGDKHPLVRVASWFERQFGRDAYAHLFVTNAMKEHLCKTWDLQGHKLVLHDRPPSRFHPTSATEAHELFLRLPPFIPSLHDFVKTPDSGSATIRTKLTSPSSESTAVGIFSSSLSPVAALRPDRPAIAISSTSWTADEDFGVLIDALQRYEHAARIRNADKSGPHLPKLLMIVTGKGPLKEAYMRRVLNLEREEKWTWVRCRSIWAEAADYPLLLGAADLGVSLHSSSSALDLPMKVVDMFGCGLPVCALDFPCLDELVLDGKNGLVFHNAEELAGQLERLLSGYPSATQELSRLRMWLQSSRGSGSRFFGGQDKHAWSTWEDNWSLNVLPLVDPDNCSTRRSHLG